MSTEKYFDAIKENRVDDLKKILDDGQDINACNEFKQGAVMIATNFSMDNGTECLSILIDRGARVNVADNLGAQPAHHAARQGLLDALKVLVEKGKAPLDAKDRAENTPQDYARKNGHSECEQYLDSQKAGCCTIQ